MNNGIGTVIIDVAAPSTGPLAPTNGGFLFPRPSTYMNTDHNIRVRKDNNTTSHQLGAVGSIVPNAGLNNKGSYIVTPNNRSNISHTNIIQANLKGNNIFENTVVDKSKTTTKQTTLYTWSGGANVEVPNSTVYNTYTETDGTGGNTRFTANKKTVDNYVHGAGLFTGNRINGNVGEVNIPKSDNDSQSTQGSGTYNRATPSMSYINNRFKEQIGKVEATPNRLQKDDDSRTAEYLISGLLKNGYSVYNNGNNVEYPVFNCSTKGLDFSGIKTVNNKMTEISKNDTISFPVNNSCTNPNELIVRNSPNGITENPMLFNKKLTCNNPQADTFCYNGPIANPGFYSQF